MKINIDELKMKTDLRSLVSPYTTLRHHHAAEYTGSCPFCGGTKRFGCQPDWFYCRDCKIGGDAIRFLMLVEHIDFLTACGRLGANVELNSFVPKTPTEPRKTPEEWSADAREIMSRAEMNLRHNETVRSYLESRYLKPETWAAFGLGAAVLPLPGTWDKEKKEACYPAQPAVAMPWINRSGDVVGIRYRFTEKHTYEDLNGVLREEVKLKSRYGSDLSDLFGWKVIKADDKSQGVLIIVEGEINAMSIWQVAKTCGFNIDVLSIGSETQRPKGIGEIASAYAGVITWADRDVVARDLMAAIPGAFGVSSPDGMDANDLLKAGQLADYLLAWAELFGLSIMNSEPHDGFQSQLSPDETEAPAPTPVPSTERLIFVFEPGSVLYGPTDVDANEYREWLWRRMQYDSAVKADMATLRGYLDVGTEIEHPHVDALRRAAIRPVEKMTGDEYLDRLFGPSGACPF